MKKISFVLIVFLMYGCSKNQNVKPQVSHTETTKDSIQISKNAVGSDTVFSNTGRLKATNSTTCHLSRTGVVPRMIASDYVIIGRFPTSSSFPSVLVPKGTWHAGPYAFNNQADGNLVVYVYATGRVLWASNTANRNTKLDLQNDLNMVLYEVNGPPAFESLTYPYKCGSANPRNAMLVLTTRGDLAIIADGTAPAGNATVVLATTRTDGGTNSPNYGSMFRYESATPVYPPYNITYNFVY